MKFLLLYLFTLSSLIADGTLRKVYFEHENITFEQDKVFVNYNNQWLQTDQLKEDQNGYYIFARDIALGFWLCDICGRANEPWQFVCKTCGQPK
jgi:hypothetical protein